MLKIVVFDSGWGGEMVADYLEEELPIVEIVRVIDWRHAPYGEKSMIEICELAEEALRQYIGFVDLIVLASHTISLVAKDFLRKKYPEQKFVGVGFDLDQSIKKLKAKRVMVLTTPAVKKSAAYLEMKQRMGAVDFLEPKCQDWVKLVDDGEMTEEKIKDDLVYVNKEGLDPPEAIIVYCTHFMDVESDLTHLFNWRAKIVGPKKMVIKDVCRALKLKGLDGRIKN